MAGDWIKMRVDLATDPAVIGIAAELGLDEDTVVGKLHKVWSWADAQCANGALDSVTLSWVSRYVCAQGFAEAMVKEGWLTETDTGIYIPNFDKHNGKPAKRRALGAKRVSAKRALAKRTKCAPEKRREEKSIQPPLPPLPESLDTAEFRRAWTDWEQHRKELKKPLTPTSVSRLYATLAKLGSVRAVVELDRSIANGWRGVFPEEDQRAAESNDDAWARAKR